MDFSAYLEVYFCDKGKSKFSFMLQADELVREKMEGGRKDADDMFLNKVKSTVSLELLIASQSVYLASIPSSEL